MMLIIIKKKIYVQKNLIKTLQKIQKIICAHYKFNLNVLKKKKLISICHI